MRPETKAAYPPNWKEITDQVKAEENYTCRGCHRQADPITGEVSPNNFLTTHHIDGNPANNERANLMCCCMVCHLKVQSKDLPPWLRVKQGQLTLFEL